MVCMEASSMLGGTAPDCVWSSMVVMIVCGSGAVSDGGYSAVGVRSCMVCECCAGMAMLLRGVRPMAQSGQALDDERVVEGRLCVFPIQTEPDSGWGRVSRWRIGRRRGFRACFSEVREQTLNDACCVLGDNKGSGRVVCAWPSQRQLINYDEQFACEGNSPIVLCCCDANQIIA